jgi:16S rRNA (cytidine1402-2'-O)-methyltransferase
MTTDQFLFAGFPPPKAKERTAWLERLADEPRPIVIFESPHRILKLLGHMRDIFGDREISLGRELTKKHEELVKGPISFVINKLTSIKGEFTLVISPSTPDKRKNQSVDKMLIYKEFCHLTDKKDLMRREAVLRLSRRHGMSSKAVYKAIEEAKKY